MATNRPTWLPKDSYFGIEGGDPTMGGQYYDAAANRFYMPVANDYEAALRYSGGADHMPTPGTGEYWSYDRISEEEAERLGLKGKGGGMFGGGGSAIYNGRPYDIHDLAGNKTGSGVFKDLGLGLDNQIMSYLVGIAATAGVGATVAGAGAGAAGAAGGAGSGGAGAAGTGNGAFLGEAAWTPTAGGGAMPGGFGATTSGLGGGLTDAGLGSITDAGISGSPFTAGPGAASAPLPAGAGGWAGATGTTGLGSTAAGMSSGASPAGGSLWDAFKSGASSLVSGGGSGGAGGLSSYVGPLASLYGAKQGADAAKDAANAQVAATREANLLAAAMFDKQIELQEPFRQAGIAGKDKLLFGLGLGGDPNAAGYGEFARNMTRADYDDDPGHQFRMDEGLKGLERSAAARGGLLSGRAAKDTMRFAQGLGTQDWNDSFNRFNINRAARLNPLQSLMGAGQSSANTMTSAAGNYGQQAGQNIIGAGNATAAGKVGSANAINSGIGSAWNMYQNNQLMNKFFPNGA